METKIINDTKCFIHNKEGKDQIDTIALRMMEQNDIAGLLPFKYTQQGRRKYFRYDIGEGETLEEWLTRAQSRKDVTKLLASLISVSGEAEAYLLEPEQICTDMQFIMVQDNKCKVAYIPLMETVQGNVLQLAQKIVTLVKYALDEDFSYLFDLQNAFGRGDIQNLVDLRKWLKIVNGEEEVAIRISDPALKEKNVSIFDGGLEEAKNISVSISKDAAVQSSFKADVGNDSFEGIFGELGLQGKQEKKKDKKPERKKNEKHGFLFKGKRKNKSEIAVTEEKEEVSREPVTQNQSSFPKEIINDLDRGDSTVMMTTGPEPVLIRMKNGMEYRISSGSYVIGSGPQADIIVADNPTVSRKHARIFVKNDSYYIEDLGSTNGTCVNGERLRKMEPYKLDDRARIQLSNEDYFFEMRA